MMYESRIITRSKEHPDVARARAEGLADIVRRQEVEITNLRAEINRAHASAKLQRNALLYRNDWRQR